ncbi:YitT family protein [Brevibacillus sp. H7]|uniref:YitT family protein n=1 Tax=Brevibacillus sp. H7 TaxID=3349138 RepID=UPI003826822E
MAGIVGKRTRFWVELGMILFGTACTAIGYYLFMKPNDITAPGLGGIAVLLGYYLPLSLGVIYFLLNVPLFLLGYRYVGGRFVLYSLMGMFSLSMFLSLFEIMPGLQQPIAGAILGGVMSGAGVALVLIAGGSTGGMDIASVVINKLWPTLTIGKVMIFLNALIVLVSGLVVDFLHSLYTLLSIYVAGKAVDICFAEGTKWWKRGGVAEDVSAINLNDKP